VNVATSLALFAMIALIIVLWATLRLLRAARLRRRGFGVDAEDRRLRADPRFTEMWVQQYRPETPPAAEREEPPLAR
jgi:hypothetical protein